jgi:hypothetical protein
VNTSGMSWNYGFDYCYDIGETPNYGAVCYLDSGINDGSASCYATSGGRAPGNDECNAVVGAGAFRNPH